MGRAHGFRAKLLFAFETNYGEAAAAGEFVELPLISTGLGGEQALEEDDTLGLGRDPSAPTYDMLKVAGQVVVPLDLRCIGYWMCLAFGMDTPVGTGEPADEPWTHTWVSGLTTLPSASIEIQYPEVPAYFLYTGVMLESFQLGVSRSGKPQVTIQLQAQNEAKATSSVDSSPISVELTRYHKFEGNIQHDDGGGFDDLANLVSGELTFSNGLAPVETVRPDELIEGIDLGGSKLSGSLVARLGDTILIDYAAGQAGVPMKYVFTRDGGLSYDTVLTLAARAAYLPKAKRSVNGPGGVESTYAWQGAKTATGSNDEMLQVVLINDTASYENGTPD